MDEPETFEFTPEETTRLNRAIDLTEVWRASSPVIVDGVCFHLSCDVDKNVWEPLHYLGIYGDRTSLYGPELIFPWTPPEVREFMARSIKVIDVEPGSTILISVVTTAKLRSPFAQFADDDAYTGKQAQLVVLHADRRVEEVSRPLVLLTPSATDAFIHVEDYSAAHHGLIARLGARAGLENLDQLIDQPLGSWPKLKPGLPETYTRALLALREGNKNCDPEPYVAFGYLMARAEAEERLLEPATRGLHAVEVQARAAAGKRMKSRADTEKLRVTARAIIKQDQEISLSRCARMVEDEIRKDPFWPFKSDDKWITRHIRELFEPRGNSREYRPRRELLG